MSKRHTIQRRAFWAVWLAVPLFSAGCVTPGPAVRDDIVTIYHFYRLEPWIPDDTGRTAGLTARVYLVPAGVEKGIFVPGTIKASLFARNPKPDGTFERIPIYEWSFDAKQAEGFRINKPSEMGESYGFVLLWPKEMNLAGREVEIRFSYDRQDGRVINGRATTLRVPGQAPRPRGLVPGPASSPTRPGSERSAPVRRPADRPGGT